MPTPTWPQIQHEIALNYCSAVLVLDDEIEKSLPDGDFVINPTFRKVREAFSNTGAICELRQIDAELDSGAMPTPLERQMQKANVLIIDWHLGKGAKDPAHAIQIINSVRAFRGFRFVGIFTNVDPADVLKGLERAFDKDFHPPEKVGGMVPEDGTTLGEDSPQPESSAVSTPVYRIGDHVYLAIVHKESTRAETTLASVFIDCLKQVFPDHLRWSALEFAARARDEMPSVLSHLPANTDVAVAFQSLMQLPDETAEGVAECLALELCEALRVSPLSAVSDATVLNRIVSGLSTAEGKNSKWHDTRWDQLKAACVQGDDRKFQAEFYELFPTTKAKKDGLKESKGTVSPILAKSLDQTHTGEPVPESHAAFASFCEHLQSVRPDRLYPGVILRKTATDMPESPEWLLCISPACDCVRGEQQRKYLFVGGSRVNKLTGHGRSSGQTCIRLNNETQHVCWPSTAFTVEECLPSGKNGYELFTRLHDAFVNQLIQTVWGHQTRAGVSTSEYVRVSRGHD